MSVAEFEQWAYSTPALEVELDGDDYLHVVGTDYRNSDAVFLLRRKLNTLARTRNRMFCECVALADTTIVDMANPGEAMTSFETIADRGGQFWWLHAARCSVCKTGWLVAQEERQNDVFLLRRLTTDQVADIVDRDEWLGCFDQYDTILRISRDAGHRATFVDPIGSSSLRWTMLDLAAGRPGIKVSAVAALLNLDLETAVVIARQAVAEGAVIDFEDHNLG